MQRLSLAFAFLALTMLSACSDRSSSSSSSFLPETDTSSTAATSSSATRLWLSTCVTCAIAMIPDKALDVDVYTTSGTHLKNLEFPAGQNLPSQTIATSPDQQHVYATIVRGSEEAVVDINPQTYAVRYYTLPVSAQESVLNLLVSPDGRRVYVPTTADLFVINTVTRAISTYREILEKSSLSPDGSTLYGTASGGLDAIPTMTFSQRLFARDPGTQATAVTTNDLYVATLKQVNIYRFPSLAFAGRVAPSPVPERLVVDNTRSRLFIWVAGSNSAYVDVVNTATQSIVRVVPDVFQGPFVDLVTHVAYYQNQNGNTCTLTPPAYAPSCGFQLNPTVTFAGTTTN